MTLRKQLESLSQQLASFHDEQLDLFEQTYHAIREAHELALAAHAADAIDIARRVTGPISPGEGRVVIAAMIAALPADPTLTVQQAAEQLGVSKETVYKLCDEHSLSHTRIGRRIIITPQQLAEYQRGGGFRHL